MKLEITARHFDVTEALKIYLEEKLFRLEKYAQDILNMHVILEMEKHSALVEVNAGLKKFQINVKERHNDMYAAIDKSFDILKKQILRHEQKIKSHRRKKTE